MLTGAALSLLCLNSSSNLSHLVLNLFVCFDHLPSFTDKRALGHSWNPETVFQTDESWLSVIAFVLVVVVDAHLMVFSDKNLQFNFEAD